MANKLTYEQSKKIFSKENILNGGGMNDAASLKKWTLVEIFLIGGLGFPMIATGLVYIPQIFSSEAVTFEFLTPEDLALMQWLSDLVRPLFFTLLPLAEIMLFVGIFLKLSLPQRIRYAQIQAYGLLMPMFFLSLVPLFGGIAFSVTGIFGVVVQLVIGLLVAVRLHYSAKKKLQEIVSGKPRGKDGVAIFDKWFKAFGPFLFLFAVLNTHVFRIGFLGDTDPKIIFEIFGWGLLILFILFSFVFEFTYIQDVSSWYFYKYAEQYRVDYEFTDAEWYGKARARRMAKRAVTNQSADTDQEKI